MKHVTSIAQLIREGATRTDFGLVKVISDNGVRSKILLVINPGRTTARESSKLNPHDGEIWQRIVHKGYADGGPQDPDKTLKYSCLGSDWRVHETFFGEGDTFPATWTDEAGIVHGFWHCNTNVSYTRPIALEVSRSVVGA